MTWIRKLFTGEAAYWVLPVIAFIAMVGVIVMLDRCGPNKEAEQAAQTTRSGEAISGAAQDAIETLEGRTVTEQNIDIAVEAATKEIDHAQDVDAVRAAVVRGLCQSPSHSDDPACIVREDDTAGLVAGH